MSLLPTLPFLSLRRGSPEDAQIAAARRGDRAAFDALVRAHGPRLRGFLMARVGPEAVEDVTQDVWTACWLALPSFTGRARFRAWLLGIAQHKCADYHRARQRRQAQEGDSLAESGDVPDAGPSVEEMYAAAELRETVQGLLAHLPAPQREVLELYYYGELTLPEIAAALARNLNTVKYQFYRAHERVAAGLECEGLPDAPRPVPPARVSQREQQGNTHP